MVQSWLFRLLALVSIGRITLFSAAQTHYNAQEDFLDTTSKLDYRADPTTCAPPHTPACAACFSGPEFNALKTELGYHFHDTTGNVIPMARKFRPVLEVGNWVGAEANSAMVRIILSELMGFNISAIVRDDLAGMYPRVANGIVTFNFEVWDGALANDREYYVRRTGKVELGMLGVIGLETVYVPGFAIEDNPSRVLTYYRALEDPANLNVFTPDGTVPRRLLMDASGRYFCSNVTGETWPHTNCTAGRYIPPQCYPLDSRGFSPHCREMLHPNPAWNQGFFEGLIKTLRLNLTISYLGYNNLVEEMARRSALRIPFIVYWWEPEGLQQKYNLQRLLFPTFTPGCHDRLTTDPTTCHVECEQRMLFLGKMADPSLTQRGQSDLRAFFLNYALSTDQQNRMLAMHNGGGGNLTTDQVACAWLKDNLNVWKPWVHNTRTRCEPQDIVRTVSRCLPLAHPSVAPLIASHGDDDYDGDTDAVLRLLGAVRRVTFAWKQPRRCFPEHPKSAVRQPDQIIPCDVLPTSSPTTSLATAAAGVATAAAALLAVALVVIAQCSSTAAVARALHPVPMGLLCCGCALLAVSPLPLSGPPTPLTCKLRPLLPSLGFTSALSALFLLTFRRLKIHRNQLLLLSDARLLLRLAPLPLLMLLLTLLNAVLPSPPPHTVAVFPILFSSTDSEADDPTGAATEATLTVAVRECPSAPLTTPLVFLGALWLLLSCAQLWQSRAAGGNVAVPLPHRWAPLPVLVLLACCTWLAVSWFWLYTAEFLAMASLLFPLSSLLLLLSSSLPTLATFLCFRRALRLRVAGRRRRKRGRAHKVGEAAAGQQQQGGGGGSQNPSYLSPRVSASGATTSRDWALKDILCSPIARAVFFEFLRTRLMGESVDFYLAVDEFKRLPDGSPQQRDEAARLLATFIKEGSEHQVNLPAGARSRVEAAFLPDGCVSAGTFDESYAIVKQLMSANALRPFLHSRDALVAEQIGDWARTFQEQQLSHCILSGIHAELFPTLPCTTAPPPPPPPSDAQQQLLSTTPRAWSGPPASAALPSAAP